MSKKREASPDSDSDSGILYSDDDMIYDPPDDGTQQFVLDELVDARLMTDLADKVSKCNETVTFLEDVLQSLDNVPIDKLDICALNHFNKVNNVWRSMPFTRVLLKWGYDPCNPLRYMLHANEGLCSFLYGIIRKDPSFQSIFNHSDDASMIRNALSILIGYSINEDLIAPLVLALGRRSLGLQCDNEDASLSVVKGDSTTHFEGGMPVFHVIADLLQDASIKELADQLSHIDDAVVCCKQVLTCLQNGSPLSKDYERLRDAFYRFWFNPPINIVLIEALKKSTSLVNVFKKYSRGAQLLRCVQRISRIREDPLTCSILGSKDLDQRVRGALSILYGYWSDADVNRPIYIIRSAQRSTRIPEGVDLTKCVIQDFEYWAHGPGDEEALKNVLADKYSKDSKEYSDLLNKMGKFHMSVKQTAPEESCEYWFMVSVLLADGEVVFFDMKRMCSTDGDSSEDESEGESEGDSSEGD